MRGCEKEARMQGSKEVKTIPSKPPVSFDSAQDRQPAVKYQIPFLFVCIRGH